MSILKTVEVIGMPARDRYGKATGDMAEAHVATTIVHDVVHLMLSQYGPEYERWDFDVEVNMTNDEARALIVALSAAIADNEQHDRL